MQRIFAIAWLTWKAALRFKLFLVIAALLVLAVVGLPLVIKDDGTAQGFTQIILTYTLSCITALLGISTLWLSCGTLARDIEECQMQVVATKPIARWQIWLGKWLGIMSLNAALLAISGACIFGLLQFRASRLPPGVQHVLRTEVLVARGAAKEADVSTLIDSEASQVYQERAKDGVGFAGLSPEDEKEMRRQIHESVKADLQLVPPGYESRPWQINLGSAKKSLPGKPLQLRVKFNTAIPQQSDRTYPSYWQVGIPGKTRYWKTEIPMSFSADTFHEFEIPPDLFDENGVLTILFYNPPANPALIFPLEDGMEVLYPQGGFTLNFMRGLGIIFCWMALLSALGLAAASFLSFPVAAFFALTMLVVVFTSGTLAESVENGTVAAGNAEKGIAGHSVADVVLIPAFKGVIALVNLVKNFSPIDNLSTGRSISWGELGLAFGRIVVLVGGIFAGTGIFLFNRRELATAQNQ